MTMADEVLALAQEIIAEKRSETPNFELRELFLRCRDVGISGHEYRESMAVLVKSGRIAGKGNTVTFVGK